MNAMKEGCTASRRVLIVEDETLVSIGLKKFLTRLGHSVIGEAANSDEARQIFREEKPDLVLMDIRLQQKADGLELAADLLKERRCPFIIVSAYSDAQLIDRAGAIGAFGYLIKPVSPEGLQAQMEVAVRRFEDLERLTREKQDLELAMEGRKLVERAKGVFMKRLGLSEPEAHRRLQQESQKRRIGLAELAKKIVESEELLGG